jgi:predicted DNA-binding transcriptional regulator YafY
VRRPSISRGRCVVSVAVRQRAALDKGDGVKNNRRVLTRQWQLVRVLSGTRFGMRIEQITDKLACSRPTVYRDIKLLTEAGVPISKDLSNGEARYRLLREAELPALGISPLQVTALSLARAQLEPLAGTGLVKELDALLARFAPVTQQQSFRFVAPHPGPTPDRAEIMKRVARSMESRRRLHVHYRAASRGGNVTQVHLEPLLVNVAASEPYVRAYCVERSAERTYKVARVVRAELTAQPFTYTPSEPPAAAFQHSVKAWGGKPWIVKVRLDSNVAWLAREYPMIAGQTLELSTDGSATVEAKVSGIVEAMRWVLSWGGAAEAVAPAELREALKAELDKAAQRYERPGLASAGRSGREGATRRNKVSRVS